MRLRNHHFLLAAVASAALASATNATPASALGAGVPALRLSPRGSTAAVRGDADDCTIWVSATEPRRAVVIGTDKSAKGEPGLHVWDLDGREIQFLPVPRPNNVDVRHGMRLGGETVDIAVCNARATHEMRVFRIDPETGRLADVTTKAGIPTPQLDDPYGLCLYRRPRDGAVFVIASSERGETRHLHQYRLADDGTGRVQGTYVRAFGGDIQLFVEGLVADDELGFVYAADERTAVRKYHADPDAGDTTIGTFAADDGIRGDREGLAIYDCGDGKGWILLSSQGNGSVKVYRREGEPGKPHAHPLVATLVTRGSRATDGLEVTSRALPGFPAGLLAKHDSKGRKFVYYSWADVASPPLACPEAKPPR